MINYKSNVIDQLCKFGFEQSDSIITFIIDDNISEIERYISGFSKNYKWTGLLNSYIRNYKLNKV